MGTYYKFRSLQNIERFLQILMNQELYASLYFELNDPMEGHFIYDNTVPEDVVKKLKDEKASTYICSLSRGWKKNIMWAMYADSHYGCCIELEVTSKPETWKCIDVEYVNEFTRLTKDSAIEDILKYKSKQWEHEAETRFIRTVDKRKNRPALKIKIKRIILGHKVKNVAFYKKIVKRILGEDVEVVKIKKIEIDNGFLKR